MKTKQTFGIVVVSFLAIIAAWAGYAMFPSASNQGYYPEQPIPFSHKLHAGDMKMDCRYCHGGAYKSATAGVPPLNVCMNCHKVVKTDSPHIQKLTKAYESNQPIEWVRIHALPDVAKFNHAPHTQKGVSCDTCHGNIREMERVEQAASLQMGWCLECHRGQTTPTYIREMVHPEIKNPHELGKLPVAPFQCSTCHN
jgi:hypothetical protein